MTYETVSSDVQRMFGSIAERYDITNSVLSLGVHHLWKRSLIRALPVKKGGRILDLCTGTGDLISPLSRKSPSILVGADFCFPMLSIAEKRFQNVATLIQGDGLNLPIADSSFDAITVAFGVRNFENLEAGLREMYRVLSPGGHVAILEFGQPDGRVFGALFKFYSKVLMPIIGGVITGDADAYAYLPETAERFPCGDRFSEILRRVGFVPKRTIRYTFGIAYGYIAEKGGAL